MIQFWSFGNRQMFENKIDPIKTYGEVTLSHHLHSPGYDHLTWIKAALICSVAIVCLFFWVWSGQKTLTQEKMLPNYWSALKVQDCEELLEDETHFRKKGGFAMLDETVVDKLN